MKKSINILLFLFTVCTFSTNMVFGQGIAGDPIPIIPIGLEGDPGNIIIARATTDANGKFTFELKEGKYKLNISYSQVEKILSNKKLSMNNIEISLLLYSKSTNAKENSIAKALVDKESGALKINILKGGALLSGVLSYEIKGDTNNTSNDLKNKIITQQPDSPKDTMPPPRSIVCYSAAGTTSWRCGLIKGGCDRLYESTAYYYSGADRWKCTELAIAFTNPDINILLNRERDGGASFEINGEIIPIASDAFVSFLAEKHIVNSKKYGAGRDKLIGGSGKDRKRNEIETFMKKDKGVVSDKRLKEISKALGIPIKRN